MKLCFVQFVNQIAAANRSKRKDFPYEVAYKKMIRKQIENSFTQITDLFPKHIHATNIGAFLLKIFLFVVAFTIL